jgi:hypothetical protein
VSAQFLIEGKAIEPVLKKMGTQMFGEFFEFAIGAGGIDVDPVM